MEERDTVERVYFVWVGGDEGCVQVYGGGIRNVNQNFLERFVGKMGVGIKYIVVIFSCYGERENY